MAGPKLGPATMHLPAPADDLCNGPVLQLAERDIEEVTTNTVLSSAQRQLLETLRVGGEANLPSLQTQEEADGRGSAVSAHGDDPPESAPSCTTRQGVERRVLSRVCDEHVSLQTDSSHYTQRRKKKEGHPLRWPSSFGSP